MSANMESYSNLDEVSDFFTFFQKNIGFDGTKTEGAGKKLYRRNDSHALFWIIFRENDENMGKTGD